MYFSGMATDPNSLTFGALALVGIGLVFVALRNVRTEVKTMVLESNDFRDNVRKIISETCTDTAKNSDVGDLKTRVRHLEAKAKLPETTAIPRERLEA